VSRIAGLVKQRVIVLKVQIYRFMFIYQKHNAVIRKYDNSYYLTGYPNIGFAFNFRYFSHRIIKTGNSVRTDVKKYETR
jgi:hypothetical protein